MEENAAEHLMCSSTEMAMAVSQKPFVMVPFQWGRYITTTGFVFYTSPSGRVLLSIEDVLSYLEEVDSCKCFYDSDMNFSEVFSFDTTCYSLALPPKGQNNCPCEKFWSESISKYWDKQLATDLLTSFVKDYIFKTEFHDKLNISEADQVLIYLISSFEEDNLYSSSNSEMEEKYQLVSVLNWKNFIVSKSGHVLPRVMSQSQLKHFTCELILKTAFELNLPPEYFVILSGKNQAMDVMNPVKKAKSPKKLKPAANEQKPKRERKEKKNVLLKEDSEELGNALKCLLENSLMELCSDNVY